jgi:hypothetical protein
MGLVFSELAGQLAYISKSKVLPRQSIGREERNHEEDSRERKIVSSIGLINYATPKMSYLWRCETYLTGRDDGNEVWLQLSRVRGPRKASRLFVPHSRQGLWTSALFSSFLWHHR